MRLPTNEIAVPFLFTAPALLKNKKRGRMEREIHVKMEISDYVIAANNIIIIYSYSYSYYYYYCNCESIGLIGDSIGNNHTPPMSKKRVTTNTRVSQGYTTSENG